MSFWNAPERFTSSDNDFAYLHRVDFYYMKNRYTCLFGRTIAMCIFLISSGLHAQDVTTNTTLTPQQLVEDILVGQGVTISNITFNGQPGNVLNNQIGLFNNGLTDGLGIDSGLVMTSGDVNSVVFNGATGPNSNITNDPDLLAIAGVNQMNNCAILEFDFVPAGDSLIFRYVFASTEYESFTCSSFNDVFGFFISGPGINGPFTDDAINIALIPGSDTPVGVNTINSGSGGNPALCESANPNWQNDTIFFVQNIGNISSSISINGYTVVLEAIAVVQCLETYHMKLAIGNAVDQALPSAVFLEAGSFQSNAIIGVDVTPVLGDVQLPDQEGIIVNCTDALFTFTRLDNEEYQLVWYEFTGTAQPGVNFNIVEDEVAFAAGSFTATMTLVPIPGGWDPAQDTIQVSVFSITVCGDTLVNTALIPIVNEYVLDIALGNLNILCPVDSVVLSGSVSNGVPLYTFNWTSLGQMGVPLTIPLPGVTTQYPVQITDVCELDVFFDTLTVFNLIQPDPIVNAGNNVTVLCSGDQATLSATSQFGQSPIGYQWSNGMNGQTIVVNPTVTTTYTVVAVDLCGAASPPDEVTVVVPVYNDLILTGSDQFSACAGAPVTLAIGITGGAGNETIVWSNGMTGSPVIINPIETDVYTVTVTDQCNTTETFPIIVTVQQYPLLFGTIEAQESFCPGDPVTLTVVPEGGAQGYTFLWQNGDTNPSTVFNPEFSSLFTVVITDACGVQSAPVLGFIEVPVYPQIIADLGSIPSCTGEEVTLIITAITGGTGVYSYEWIGPGEISVDQTTGRAIVQNPGLDSTYTLIATDECFVSEAFSFVPEIVGVRNIPNVITPNGDNRNDIFVVPGLQFFPNAFLVVFNRWGTSVYETNDYRNDWGGGDLERGTYFYVLKVDNGKCVFNGDLQIQN